MAENIRQDILEAGRNPLTGAAPANAYQTPEDKERITLAPDGRPAEEQPAWRQDFAIDWPQDHYVARRDFMKFLVLISGAFVAGQLWIAFENWRRARRGELPVARIASTGQVPVGGVLVFAYPGEHDNCVLIRTGEEQYLAYSQKCTHLSCAVIPKPEKGIIYCPCHEGFFDLKTGNVLAGPPPRPLPRIKLEIRGREIFATGVEERGNASA